MLFSVLKIDICVYWKKSHISCYHPYCF